jgi:hypothetical protein
VGHRAGRDVFEEEKNTLPLPGSDPRTDYPYNTPLLSTLLRLVTLRAKQTAQFGHREDSERYRLSNIPQPILPIINYVLLPTVYTGTVVIQECVRFRASE